MFRRSWCGASSRARSARSRRGRRFVTAAIEGAAGEVDAPVAAVRPVAVELASGNISQEEVDRAPEPLLAARRQTAEHAAI